MFGSHFSSDIPFTLFSGDANQYSIHDLKEDDKKFLWHQFMLHVLLNIPRSLTSIDDIIANCSRLLHEDNESDAVRRSKKASFDEFRKDYRSENAVYWYTRPSFFCQTLNKACRMLNSSEIVPFHPLIKDVTAQLKQLQTKQRQDGKLQFPLTVYRGQEYLGKGELEKIKANEGHLISMNTFLSTSKTSAVPVSFIEDSSEVIPVIFEITVQNFENGENSQIFAYVDQNSGISDEQEILFGMSSVFKIISVESWGWAWEIKLEVTSCEGDKNLQKFMHEIKNYLFQISGKEAPFILLKQLFTTTSLNRIQPFTEFVKYFMMDVTYLFIINVYNKDHQLKQLIDMEPGLHELLAKTNHDDNIHSNERVIYLLFDLLNNFYHRTNKEVEEDDSVDHNDVLSLYCFGGFLLLTGEYDKAIEYLQMLLKHNSFNEITKASIYAILAEGYVLMRDRHSATESLHRALQSFEYSMDESTPPWLATTIASSFISQEDPDQIPERLQSCINKEQSDNDVLEKIRMIHNGRIHFEQKKFVQALNHWEGALEITSYMPTSLLTMLNGVIYVQMAAAYFRLDNIPKALDVMEKAKNFLEKYYPSNHRLFGGFNFLYGYYLILNEKSSQSITCLNTALVNPYFSSDSDFIGIVYCLLIMSYIHSGDLDSAEECGRKAQPYISPNNMSSKIPDLLAAIPEVRMITKYENSDFARQFICTGLEEARKLLFQSVKKSVRSLQHADEQNATIDQWITAGDYYRHRQDYPHVQIYYTKALEQSRENDWKYLWNIYKKIVRMNDRDRYDDDFARLYSKYDDENPKDFEIISALQIINYKLNLSKNQTDLAFDCLMYGVFMRIKYLYYQNTIHSNYIYDLFRQFASEEKMIKIISLLTKFIEIYFTDGSKFLRKFFVAHFSSNGLYENLAKIIHHEQMDIIMNEIQSKPLSLFANALLKLIRQSIPSSDKSTLLLKDQCLEFIQKYNNEKAPLFYLMKIFQALLTNDAERFYHSLEKFRLNCITLENYQKLKEKISNVFQQLEEDWLSTSLHSIATSLLIQ